MPLRHQRRLPISATVVLGDDLLSSAIDWTIEGEPIKDSDLFGLCLFVFIAGLDTVAAQLAWIFHHLAGHAGHRRRLIDNPEVIPQAVEEYLRAYRAGVDRHSG